jgi:hypothetical protein
MKKQILFIAIAMIVAVLALVQLTTEQAYACFGYCAIICDGVPASTQCNCTNPGVNQCHVSTCGACGVP